MAHTWEVFLWGIHEEPVMMWWESSARTADEVITEVAERLRAEPWLPVTLSHGTDVVRSSFVSRIQVR